MDEKIKFIIFIGIIFFIQYNDCSKLNKRSVESDYSGSKVIRVVPIDQTQLEFLKSLGTNGDIRFWLRPTHVGKNSDIEVPDNNLKDFEKLLTDNNLSYEVLVDDLGNKINSAKIQSYSMSDDFFDNYQRVDAIYKELTKINKENPEITSITSIGKSFEGRDIRLLKIGVGHKKNTKTIFYIDSGTHAREWAGVSTSCYIIDKLIDDYNNNDKTAVYLLKKYDFYVIPVVNPDGYEYTHTHDRMWRKNRATFEDTKCVGTDVNRNYDFHWGGIGSSHDPCDESYCGPEPFSEVESVAVSNFILKHKKRMLAYVTLHAYGQYFLFPWGWTTLFSPHKSELKRVADISAKAIYNVHKTKYSVGSPSEILYVSQGSDDWAHGVAKIPYVYCLEMRDLGKHGFILPKEQIKGTGEETYVGIKAMIKAIEQSPNRKSSNKRSKNKNKQRSD